MGILKEADIDICVDRFRELITKEVDIADLHKVLDFIYYDYTRRLLTDEDIVGMKGNNQMLYYLRILILLFMEDDSLF